MPRVAKAAATTKITAAIASKVLEVVDAGLVNGMGVEQPGKMCVEAAVCYAMGEPHSAQPKCVLPDICDCKIGLNDHKVWGYDERSNMVRSKGLRRLAIAQLGSKGKITNTQWDKALKAYIMKSPAYKKHQKQAVAEQKKVLRDLQRITKTVKAGKYVEDSINYAPLNNFDFNTDYIFDNMNATTVAKAKKVCEDIVQILIKLKSPGTKYLYLTEGGKKRKSKKRVAKKRTPKKHK